MISLIDKAGVDTDKSARARRIDSMRRRHRRVSLVATLGPASRARAVDIPIVVATKKQDATAVKALPGQRADVNALTSTAHCAAVGRALERLDTVKVLLAAVRKRASRVATA